MKKLGLLCMVMALFFSGCLNKKKHTEVKEPAKESSEKLLTSRLQDTDSSFQEETDNLFDDSNETTLALASDDFDSIDQNFDADQDDTVNLAMSDFNDTTEEAYNDSTEYPSEDYTTAANTQSQDFKSTSLNDLDLDFDFEDDNGGYEEFAQADFETVHYGFNKRTPLQEENNLIEKNIELAKKLTQEGKTITIAGHGCQLGSEAQNMLVSAQRAAKMKAIFVEHGVPAEKIKTVGYGYEAPLVWTNEVDREKKIQALAPNRRIDITVS